MPDFAKATIADTSQDLSGYTAFLRKLEIGQVVTLPLEPGERSRAVVRSLNLTAEAQQKRLARLPSDAGSIRFRVLSPDKRAVNISDEAKQARVEKARATREARRQEQADLVKMGQGDPVGEEVMRAMREAEPEDAEAPDVAEPEDAEAPDVAEPETVEVSAPSSTRRRPSKAKVAQAAGPS
jgi:hypothetical protein